MILEKNKTLRSVHFGVVVVELINCKCGGIVRNKYGKSKALICEIWDLSGYSEKSNIQEAYLPKTSISGQIVPSRNTNTPPPPSGRRIPTETSVFEFSY